jgi:hypothetical protein
VTLEREDVGYILREKNLAIDVEHFKVHTITYERLLPDGTNFAKYFQELFAYPSADVLSLLSKLMQKNQVVASLLQRQCLRLIKLTAQQPEGIRTKINEALIRFLGSLVTAHAADEVLEVRNRFKADIGQCLDQVPPYQVRKAKNVAGELAEWGWRLTCILVGEDDVKLRHLNHILPTQKAEANGLASWIVAQGQFSAELRKLAISFLAQYGTEELIPVIRNATKDSEPDICAEAAKALKLIRQRKRKKQ